MPLHDQPRDQDGKFGARSHAPVDVDLDNISAEVNEAWEHLQRCSENETDAKGRLRAMKATADPSSPQDRQKLDALYAEVDVRIEETQEAGMRYVEAALIESPTIGDV